MRSLSKNQELINNYSSLDLKILPSSIKKNGYDYNLVKRENDKCIYSQSSEGFIHAYEVFRTRIVKHREGIANFLKNQERKEDLDSLEEYREVFPGDEEFGKRAWSCKTLPLALEKFKALQ